MPSWTPLAPAIMASAALHAAGMSLLQAKPAGSADASRAPLQVLLQAAAPAPEKTEASRRASAPAPAPAGLPRHYYKVSELDVKPGVMVHVEPRYPERAAQDQASGRVRAHVFLREDGTVEHVSIVQADPAGYFEYSVQQAFGAARFTPGIKDGRAVKVQMAFEVSFGDAR